MKRGVYFGLFVQNQYQQPKEIIKFDHVGLHYDIEHNIFHNLNFTFFSGSFYFLTGQSGIGKTSLLKLIYNDVQATRGVVKVFDKDISALSEKERVLFLQKIGLVFQDCRLINHLTALDNVALAMKILGSDIKKAKLYAKELLHWVGLGKFMNSLPCNLSDGQKQRVGIARAVITRPILLLADEPTGNVDDFNAIKMINLFEELNKMGTTVIVATHNRQVISHFSYPELYINQGQLHLMNPNNFSNQHGSF